MVIEYDKATGYRWRVIGSMPPDSLIGMLEILQSILIDGEKMRLMQAAQAQQQAGIVAASSVPPSPFGRPHRH